MRTVHFMATLPSRLAGFVSGTARQPCLSFGKFVMSWHVYMLLHHYSAQIQLGIHHFVFTVLHNHTQALPTTDEEVPVLKNLQSKIRSNTSEGNNRKEWGVQEESWATAHLGETCILVGQLKNIIHPIQAPISLCMVIMEEISEHRKGWLKDGGHSLVRLRKVSPISWAHSCRWVPWLICQRHDHTCQSTRISSIVTSQTRWLVRSQCARPKALIT